MFIDAAAAQSVTQTEQAWRPPRVFSGEIGNFRTMNNSYPSCKGINYLIFFGIDYGTIFPKCLTK